MKKLSFTSTNKIVPFVNALVYGEAGVGKTVLCSTAPKPFIISTEGGMLSLQDENITVFEVRGILDIKDIYQWLIKSKESQAFTTVCMDSLSEVAEVLLMELLPNFKDPRQAYGEMATEMSKIIRDFRDIKKHTYFTAKVRILEDENTGRITYRPSVPGQMLLNNLPYFFDEVFILEFARIDKKLTRAIRTVGDTQWIAKDRSGRLNKYEPPNLTTVINKMTKLNAKEVKTNGTTTN